MYSPVIPQSPNGVSVSVVSNGGSSTEADAILLRCRDTIERLHHDFEYENHMRLHFQQQLELAEVAANAHTAEIQRLRTQAAETSAQIQSVNAELAELRSMLKESDSSFVELHAKAHELETEKLDAIETVKAEERAIRESAEAEAVKQGARATEAEECVAALRQEVAEERAKRMCAEAEVLAERAKKEGAEALVSDMRTKSNAAEHVVVKERSRNETAEMALKAERSRREEAEAILVQERQKRENIESTLQQETSKRKCLEAALPQEKSERQAAESALSEERFQRRAAEAALAKEMIKPIAALAQASRSPVKTDDAAKGRRNASPPALPSISSYSQGEAVQDARVTKIPNVAPFTSPFPGGRDQDLAMEGREPFHGYHTRSRHASWWCEDLPRPRSDPVLGGTCCMRPAWSDVASDDRSHRAPGCYCNDVYQAAEVDNIRRRYELKLAKLGNKLLKRDHHETKLRGVMEKEADLLRRCSKELARSASHREGLITASGPFGTDGDLSCGKRHFDKWPARAAHGIRPAPQSNSLAHGFIHGVVPGNLLW